MFPSAPIELSYLCSGDLILFFFSFSVNRTAVSITEARIRKTNGISNKIINHKARTKTLVIILEIITSKISAQVIPIITITIAAATTIEFKADGLSLVC